MLQVLAQDQDPFPRRFYEVAFGLVLRQFVALSEVRMSQPKLVLAREERALQFIGR
jgi:hypothetical protein